MKDEEFRERGGCAIGTAFVWIALAMLGAAFWAICLTGCTTTKYIPVETVRTEYKDKVREVHTTDSVTDTRFVYVRGDTVIDYRDRVKWRDRFIHDTCTVIKADSIPIPYPVECKLTWWQQTKLDLGGYAIVVIIAAISIAVVWIARKFGRR